MNQLTVITPSLSLMQAGQVANRAAADHVFSDYRSRKSENTLIAQDNALALFVEYLTAAGVVLPCYALAFDPECWQGMTWGIVEGFVKWQLGKGYSVASVNNRLSCIKTYAKLAAKAGTIAPQDLALIKTVSGYGNKEAKRIDERREVTRVGNKKAEHVKISLSDAKTLTESIVYGDTPQGRRDLLLMCLMLEHGLRVGEVAGLMVTNFDLKAGELRFYRPKVDLVQTHKLSSKTLLAAIEYFKHDAPAMGRAILGSTKGGKLTSEPMSERAMTKRVNYLAKTLVGLEGVSAHDCRHYWATYWAKKVDTLPKGLLTLQESGGWSSLEMPRHYIENSRIANEGMV